MLKPTLKANFIGIIVMTLISTGCSSQQRIIDVHNKIVLIESEMIDDYNDQSTAYAQAEIIRSAVRKLERLDTNDLPQDYKNAILDVKDLWDDWQRALDRLNIEKADTLVDLHVVRVENLNKVAESHGMVIQRP